MTKRQTAIERIRETLKQKTRYDRQWSHSRLAYDYFQLSKFYSFVS